MTLICQKWRARPKARRRVVPNAAERAVDDVVLWCIAQRQAGMVSKDIAAQIGRSREWVRTATNRVVKEDRDGLDYWAANPFPENKQKPRLVNQ